MSDDGVATPGISVRTRQVLIQIEEEVRNAHH